MISVAKQRESQPEFSAEQVELHRRLRRLSTAVASLAVAVFVLSVCAVAGRNLRVPTFTPQSAPKVTAQPTPGGTSPTAPNPFTFPNPITLPNNITVTGDDPFDVPKSVDLIDDGAVSGRKPSPSQPPQATGADGG